MWSLFGLRKDSKKSTPDKEVDGGFVIVGKEHIKMKLYIKLKFTTCFIFVFLRVFLSDVWLCAHSHTGVHL